MKPQQLREIRQSHKLTQKAMGLLLGYSESYIRRLENSREPITQRFEKLFFAFFPVKKKRKVKEIP